MNNDNAILRWWHRIRRWPGGGRLFSFALNRYIPYTGSMGSTVVNLQPGYARVRLRERRSVRNHLNSIHAIALANLAEYTGNLALVAGMPDDARFIPKRISVDYLKKARGVVFGECQTEVLLSNTERDVEIQVEIKDSQGEIVATATINSLVGPKKKKTRTE